MPQVVHSTFQGLELHEDKRIKVPVRAASTANVSLAAPGATIDGVTLVASDRVLLKNQTTPSQNGIYVWAGAATALTRATDANTAALLFFGFLVYVREGTANGGTLWMFTQSAAITLETTALAFSAVGATNLSGEMTAADFKVTGLTGATAGMRIVGATASGAPTTGTFAVGDVVEDQAAGGFWACTVAGTPGTWIRNGFANPMTAVGDLIVGGTAGAPTRLGAGGSLQVLTANGAGVAPSWQAATGGGGGGTGLASNGTVPIQTIGPLSAAQASVSFAVPAGYRNLRLVWQARGDTAATSTNMQLQFNGDTGANYDRELLFNNTSTTAANSEALAATSMVVGIAAANTAPAGATGSGFLVIPNYSSTTFRKQIQGLSGFKSSDTAGFGNDVWVGEWRSTAAVTSIVLALAAGNFATGSFFQLWGELDSAPTLPASQSSLIQEVVLGTAAATISLANLPQTYRDLRLEIIARGDTASLDTQLRLQFNGDATAGHYAWQRVNASATTVAGAGSVSDTAIEAGWFAAATSTAGQFDDVEIVIPGYAGVTTPANKSIHGRSSEMVGGPRIFAHAGNWSSGSAAITSILLTPAAGNFVAGTVVRLYGEPATSLPKIAETVLTAAQASITFSAIPQTYRNLRLCITGRVTDAATNKNVVVQFNGDTTAANYASEQIQGIGTTAGVQTNTTDAGMRLGDISGTTATPVARPSVIDTIIHDYARTAWHKIASGTALGLDSQPVTGVFSGWWASTAAITSITVTTNGTSFTTDTVVTLYGEP